MTAKIRYPVGKAWIDVEANSVKEAIRELSEFVEVLGHSKCGACGSENVQPRHRIAQSYDFYEMKCLSCGAALSFGQTREGDRLFPKVKDNDGNWLQDSGWTKWQGNQRESSRSSGGDDEEYFA